MMKKIGVCLISLFMLVTISGCHQKIVKQGVADNEILTLKPVDQSKTLVVIRIGDNNDGTLIEKMIEAKFDDIDVVCVSNTADTTDMIYNDYGDIYLSSDKYFLDIDPSKNFIDLSGEDYLNNYYLSMLNECQNDDKIYYLPGPASVLGIIYDKEMFAENGWEVPTSQSQFIELCKTIENTGIRSLQQSFFYNSSTKVSFAAFNYKNCFAGVENYEWLEKYKNGDTSMNPHLLPAMETMQKFIDAKIIQSQDFDIRPSERTTMMYRDHTTAMIVESQAAISYAKEYGEGQEHEIGMLPFYSGDEANSDYLISSPSFYMAANIKLKEQGNEKKLEAVQDILAYLSTVEGQTKLINDTTAISYVKGVELKNSDFMSGIQDTIEKGHLVSLPSYGKRNVNDIDLAFTEYFKKFVNGEVQAVEVLQRCDQIRDQLLLQKDDYNLKTIGQASQDFTVLELSQYVADIFKRETEAQIGLCRANTRRSGVNIKLYKGDITMSIDPSKIGFSTGYYIGRGFSDYALSNDNYSLIKVKMSGKNIKEALTHLYDASDTYPAAYTVASGLKIEFAPWAKEEDRIQSITLEDGTPLEDNRIYTVATWTNSIDPQLIESIEENYTHDFLNLFEKYVSQDKSIAPFNDDRFRLNWDIVE